MAYGIQPQGFVIKDLQTILQEIKADMKTQFGQDLDTSDEGVAGQLAGNFSKKFAQMWDLAAAVYSSLRKTGAEGQLLDEIAAYVNVEREGPRKTQVVEALYADVGTSIPLGHLLKQSSTGLLFASKTAITIALDSLLLFNFSVGTVLPSTTYQFQIDGITISFVSSGSPTEANIRAGLVADLASKFPTTITATDHTTYSTIQIADGQTPFSLVWGDAHLTLISQAGYNLYEAQTAGVLPVPLGSLDTIQNPISGLASVTNLVDGVTGRDTETDSELRVRLDSAQIQGKATDEAIRSALLSEVPNVSFCKVFSNRTNGTVSGRPAHTFEAVVQGGLAQEIADKIWEYQPAGIDSYGSVSNTVTDSMGHSQTVKFSRPTPKYIWIKFEITRYSEEVFPTDGGNIITESAVAWGAAYLDVGKDVIRERLFASAFSVPGVASAVISIVATNDLTPPGAYFETNIAIGETELALVDSARIQVLVS